MAIDVVLTGFEPFGGGDSNPSWEAVALARPMLRGADLRWSAGAIEWAPCATGLLDTSRLSTEFSTTVDE